MIYETIVTTQNREGVCHIAPMGVHCQDGGYVIMPFKPSATLDNLLTTGYAVLNYTDDVRVFAGCLTGRRDWPLQAAAKIDGYYLQNALAHAELKVTRHEDDAVRPRIYCQQLHSINHAPFQGFNRAQFAVVEAAILVSRLGMLSWDKIGSELEYLRIGFEKTAGVRELEAWGWLMERVEHYKSASGSQP